MKRYAAIKPFKDWLFEKELSEEQKKYVKVKDLISLGYENFVDELKSVSKIPKIQKILNQGKDDGNMKDEVIEVNDKANFFVSKLTPTQSQIGLGDSIGYLCDKDPEGAKNIIKGDTSGFNNNRILTANGKYILDGHHRWSQVFCLNPDATIPAIDLNIPGDSKKILKIIQAGIAATYKDIYKKPADSKTDIFDETKIPKNQIGEKLKEIIKNSSKGDKFLDVAKESYGVKDGDEVIDIISKNALMIKDKKPENAPKRDYMPQPSDTAIEVGVPPEKTKDFKGMPKDFINKLRSGDLNFKPPFTRRIKHEK